MFYRRKKFISEDRKMKLISDVDSLVPIKLKNLLSLIDKIVETDEKTLLLVYRKIEESGESVHSIIPIIEHALKIRPLNTKPLLTLHCLLSQMHGYKKRSLNDCRLYSMLLQQGIVPKQEKLECMNEKDNVFQEDEVIQIIKQDDIDSYIKKSSEPGFKQETIVDVNINSPFAFVKDYSRGYLRNHNPQLSYLQIIAFYGAAKCFKHASLNKMCQLECTAEYAIAGGNLEIVHILEQMDVSFETCLEVSNKFHRNELSDWILIHYKCLESSLSSSCLYFNYRAVIFSYYNGFRNSFCQAAANGHLEVIKYLFEQCHANVEANDGNGETHLFIASSNGHLDIIKYLHETWHANVDARHSRGWNPLSIASAKGYLDIVKYLCEQCHANVETKINGGWTPISIASQKGHLEIVKYLYETCHADIETKDIFGHTPINNASCNGHHEIVKYLSSINSTK